MTVNAQEQAQAPQEQVASPKEINFRKQEQMYQKMLQEKEAEIQKLQQQYSKPQQDEDDYSEPYVDHRRLDKKLKNFEESQMQKLKEEAKKEVYQAIEEERRQMWLKSNQDFTDVLQHAEKLYQVDAEMAETILKMPDNFERQKLVYKTIKNLGLHKPAVPEQSMQDKVNANRRSPYYQPSGIGSAPYISGGDFSKDGQKRSFEKMQELKRNLRLG